jgi:hypothetical protein
MTNEQRSTTMLYKRLNFSVSTVRKLRKSLKHSLRIHSKEQKRIEWDEDLSHNNIYIIDGKRIHWNEAAALSYIQETLAPFHKINRTKEQRQEDIETKGKYKYKIKKIIKDETGNPAATYLEELIGRKDRIDGEQVAQDFEGFEISRKAQKLKSVQTYIDLHNSIIQAEKPLDARKTVIQEAFFKFPMHNQVDLPPDFYIDAIQAFYAEHFPDYKILLTVYHGDELEGKSKNKVGDHPHIFIDCKNIRTGEYDLTEQQAMLANVVIETVDFFKDYPPINVQSQTYQESQIIGEALQELFYQHINQFLKEIGVELTAERLELTQEELERRKEMRLESKKPKEQRAFNLYTMKQEQLAEAKNKLENVRNDIDQKEGLNDKLSSEIAEKATEVVKVNQNITNLQKAEETAEKRYKDLNRNITEKQKEMDNLDDSQKQTEQKILQLNTKGRKMLGHFKSKKVKLEKELVSLEGQIAENKAQHERLTKAIEVLNEKLHPLIHDFDVKVDRITLAKRLDEDPNKLYKTLKKNLYETARYLGAEKRKDYEFNVKEMLKEQGLDPNKIKLGYTDRAKLWISDTFTDKQTIEFDKEEATQAAEARKKRMLKPKPPSPFKDPYDPYQ